MVNIKPLFSEQFHEQMKTVIENAKNLYGSMYPLNPDDDYTRALEKAVKIEDLETRKLVVSLAASVRYAMKTKAESYETLGVLVKQLETIQSGMK